MIQSGPFPLPDMVRGYNEVTPGLGDRIIALVEDQARHRMQMEKEVTRSDSRRAWGGLVAAVVISLAFLGVGGALVYAGYPGAGGTIATSVVGALAGTFVYGTRSRRLERSEKARMLTRRA